MQIQSFCPHLKVTKVSLITERHVLSPNLVQVTSPLLVLHASENDLNEKHICITKCKVFYPNWKKLLTFSWCHIFLLQTAPIRYGSVHVCKNLAIELGYRSRQIMGSGPGFNTLPFNPWTPNSILQ